MYWSLRQNVEFYSEGRKNGHEIVIVMKLLHASQACIHSYWLVNVKHVMLQNTLNVSIL